MLTAVLMQSPFCARPGTQHYWDGLPHIARHKAHLSFFRGKLGSFIAIAMCAYYIAARAGHFQCHDSVMHMTHPIKFDGVREMP